MHPVLRNFAREACETVMHLSVYLGLIGALGLAVAELVPAPASVAAIAPLPGWVEVVRPSAAVAVDLSALREADLRLQQGVDWIDAVTDPALRGRLATQ